MFKLFLLLIFLILIGNLLLLDYFFVSQRGQLDDFKLRVGSLADSVNTLGKQLPSGTFTTAATPSANVNATFACPQSCQNLIGAVSAKVDNLPATSTPKASPTVSQRGEYVIPLGSGSVPGSQAGQWVNVYTAQGVVDTNNYSNIKAIYFEVIMHIPNVQGEVRAKLIDDTTPFSYDGQVLVTQSGTGKLLSVAVPLVSGKKTYHVQLYTTISDGTLDSARIRIVTQ